MEEQQLLFGERVLKEDSTHRVCAGSGGLCAGRLIFVRMLDFFLIILVSNSYGLATDWRSWYIFNAPGDLVGKIILLSCQDHFHSAESP